jgi:hypothetical protein
MSDCGTFLFVRQKADLARAEHHIADGERRITGQMQRIEELRADGPTPVP